jgi:multicomponent Na+:H+ antiporter subunit B
MRKLIGILLVGGFAFYLLTVGMGLFSAESSSELDSIGAEILSTSPRLSGAANTVTAVVVQYRGFDTLGEVTVLFVSALGVSMLAMAIKDGLLQDLFDDDGGFVLQAGSLALLPFIVLVGLYIILHGHLSPGGGFPGGVIIATAVFVVILTSKTIHIPGALISILESLAGLGFLAIGLIGLYSPAQSFLANILPKGEFGTILSAGFIPLIYAIVAVKVASELINIISKLTAAGSSPEEASE